MFVALLGALAIGVSLGLLGSGGSILTVPILVYLVGQPEKVAIAGSLLIVGSIAAVGGLHGALRRQVDWFSVLWFGLPGMAGTWFGARLSMFVGGRVQMLLFVAVMLAAGAMMLRPLKLTDATAARRSAWKISIEGLLVGVLTGLVGVGGGFMIVPALVLLGGLPMHRAVGTSLLIIALKSFSGFVKYLDVLDALDLALDWAVLGMFTGVGIVGTLAGGGLSRRFDQAMLQRGFAVLLLLIAVGLLLATLASFGAARGNH